MWNENPHELFIYPVLHSFKLPALEVFLQADLEPLVNKHPVLQRTEGVIFHFFSCHNSCYGTVSSLNGEPEQGVAVEAVGQKDCSIYGEDTVTDEEGKFRLRGLLVRLVLGWVFPSCCQWCPCGIA